MSALALMSQGPTVVLGADFAPVEDPGLDESRPHRGLGATANTHVLQTSRGALIHRVFRL